MTLVLAACVGDAVVMAADSLVQVGDPVTKLPVPGATTIDKKLFKFARVGIATYGTGPPEHVPTVISALHRNTTVITAIDFLQNHFHHAPGMGALIGGIDESGLPVLFDLPMSTLKPNRIVGELGRPLQVVLRGVKNEFVDLDHPGTPSSAMEQMMKLLHDNIGPTVGPPFELLDIIASRPDAP